MREPPNHKPRGVKTKRESALVSYNRINRAADTHDVLLQIGIFRGDAIPPALRRSDLLEQEGVHLLHCSVLPLQHGSTPQPSGRTPGPAPRRAQRARDAPTPAIACYYKAAPRFGPSQIFVRREQQWDCPHHRHKRFVTSDSTTLQVSTLAPVRADMCATVMFTSPCVPMPSHRGSFASEQALLKIKR